MADASIRRYPRSLLLQLSRSPLVSTPEGLPPLSKWYGEYEHPHTPHHRAQELPRDRPQRTERNGREEVRKDRREREREPVSNGDVHDPAQPFGAMGDFRIPNRTAKRLDRDVKEEPVPNGDMRAKREDDNRFLARKQGRAEEGGWRTGRTLSDRPLEQPRRMDEGRRDRDRDRDFGRREVEPAWMDDAPSGSSRSNGDDKKVWQMSVSLPEVTDLGGHVDKLQAFKAQMRAMEERERGGSSSNERRVEQPVETQRPPREERPAEPPAAAPPAVPSGPLTLASLGLSLSKKPTSEMPSPEASTSGIRSDPAIAAVSAPRERESSAGPPEEGGRRQGSRFAKFFKGEPPSAAAPTPAPVPAPAAAAPSALPSAHAAPPALPMDKQGSASQADQESFRRLMDMLQMSAAPPRPADSKPPPGPSAHAFSSPPPMQGGPSPPPGFPPGLQHQRAPSSGPQHPPFAGQAAYQQLPPTSQPPLMNGPRPGAGPPGLPHQMFPPGLNMHFNGPPGAPHFGMQQQQPPPPGFPRGPPPMSAYPYGPPPQQHTSPPPQSGASQPQSITAQNLLGMFTSGR